MTDMTENLIDLTLRELAEARATVNRLEAQLIEWRGKLVGIRGPRQGKGTPGPAGGYRWPRESKGAAGASREARAPAAPDEGADCAHGRGRRGGRALTC